MSALLNQENFATDEIINLITRERRCALSKREWQHRLAGYGYCILPCFMAAAHRDLERILPVDARIVRSYWLVSHAEMRAPARTRATIEFLDATVQTYRRLFLPS